MFERTRTQRASILILALWVLMFLTVFASAIGLKVRNRMMFFSRLEDRSRLHYVSEAGIKLAIAALRQDMAAQPLGLSAQAKQYRFNNPEFFARIELEDGTSYVGTVLDDNPNRPLIQYGVIDEERKINVNTADFITLKRLIEQVSDRPDAQIDLIVVSILDWRDVGDSQLEGFTVDEYYVNLPFPYQQKDAPLELIEELLLIQGVDGPLLEALKPFITIYGDGLININTAPLEVIVALGLDEPIAVKLLEARAGLDGIEATEDDHIFINAFDVTRDVGQLIELEKDELIQIDFLNAAGKIKTSSFYFGITATGTLENKRDTSQIACVYNARDNIIEYWREN